MIDIEQIKSLAGIGAPVTEVEAALQRRMTVEERQAYYAVKLRQRIEQTAAERRAERPFVTNIKDSVYLDAIKREVKRGHLISRDALQTALGIFGENHQKADDLKNQLLKNFYEYAAVGKRMRGENFEAFELLDQRAADEYRELISKKSTALSTADRVANLVSRRSEIGPLPAIAHADRREACEKDLAHFGTTYCGVLLRHEPSAAMLPFIQAMQKAVLVGGKIHVRWPRGKGKSTWIKIAIIWALVYGHRHFAMCFAANAANARKIIGNIWSTMEESDEMLEDFPEVCIPIRKIRGVSQRCQTQTQNGESTNIHKTGDLLRLPTIEGSISSGAVIVCRGVEAGTKGLVDMDQRPDFLFFDDIQSKKSSGSQTRTDWMEQFVMQDAMCMSGHDVVISALMASTPVEANDLSERFADSERHPEWIAITTPLVIRWPANMELVEEFGALYKKDLANGDLELTMSRMFYEEHQSEIENGAEVLDPLDGDPQTEISAFHHALVLLYSIQKEGFDAEYQMKTRRAQEVFSLEPGTICRALNHYARCIVPDECRGVVGFVDVNSDGGSGLRWELMAFGSQRVGATIAYGRYPAKGRLYPDKATSTQMRIGIAKGIVALTQLIAELPIRKKNGQRVGITAVCFDLGWETQTVARAIKMLRLPFHCIGSHGFGYRKYQPYKPGGDLRDGIVGSVGDHCHLAESQFGVFLAFHADYWREEAQRSFLAPPLQPGSCSLWGDDFTEHYDFASEICNEKLADKGTGQNGTDFWLWNKTGKNHWGDTHSGCFAVASWYRLYDATEIVVNGAVNSVGAAGKNSISFQRERIASNAQRLFRKRRFKLV